MRIYKSLRSLLSKTTQNQRKTTRTFLTTGRTGSTQTQNHHPHLHTKWGPLFRSSPPCNLSRSSSTPTGHKAPVLGVNLEGLALIKGNHEKELGSGSGRSVAGRVKEEEKSVENGEVLRSYLNLPNFISLARLVSGPFIGWMITNEMYTEAFVGLVISGASDWLDGYVARKMKIDSVVGSYLDPLADKVLIGSVALAMVHQNLLHPGLVGLVVLRDVVLVGGAVYHRASSLGWKCKSWYDFVNLDGTRPEKVEPLFISKVNTVLQLGLVAGALLQPEFGTPETEPYITYLSWMVATTTVASTTAYWAKYMGNRSLLLAKKS